MIDLFEYKDGDIRVDLSIKVINEFAALINRDKDRKKRRSTAEIAWIFHMNSHKSPYAHRADREQALVNDLDLPDNWKPDDLVKAANDKYVELFVNTSSLQLLSSLRDSLNSANKLIRILQQKIDAVVSSDELPVGDDLDEAIGYLESLMKIADKLPNTLNRIKDVEDKVRKDEAATEGKHKVGGGKFGYFEDPH